MVNVCKGASSVAPAECLDFLPKNLSDEVATSLCGRAQGIGPAVCANVRSQLQHGAEMTASLCRGASGEDPANCFQRSSADKTLSPDERVELCREAKSDAPARYGTALPRRLLCGGHQGSTAAQRNLLADRKTNLSIDAHFLSAATQSAATQSRLNRKSGERSSQENTPSPSPFAEAIFQ